MTDAVKILKEDSGQKGINTVTLKDKIETYKMKPSSFLIFLSVALAGIVTVGILGSIIVYILVKGIPNLTPELFAWEYTSENASMMPAIINTVLMTALSLAMAVPVGVFSAIYMVEYAKRGSRLVKIISLTAETLAGIPSIIYGLFGYLMFVIALGWNLSFLGGAITLAIMVLPTIMRTTQEALKAVPDSFREGSFGLGAGKLRTIFRIILPAAVPGILSGIVLSIGRIAGETAALLYPAGTQAKVVTGLFDSGCTLSVHMYKLMSEGLYTKQAYATAVVLLVMVLLINRISARIAKKLQKTY